MNSKVKILMEKYSDLIKYHSKKDDPNLLDLFEY